MAIPKVTIVPLLALWLGIGLTHKITIVFLFCFFTILVNTITGIKQTKEKHLKVSKVYEASRSEERRVGKEGRCRGGGRRQKRQRSVQRREGRREWRARSGA